MGTYTVAVSDAGDSTGAYSVRVVTTRAEAPTGVLPGSQDRTWQPNANGNQVAQDALTDAQPAQLWAIHPKGLGTLSIGVTAPGYGAVVGLYDSLGNRVAQSVSNAGQQATIVYAVSMEDTYYIEVSSTSGVSTGPFTLSINAPVIPFTPIVIDPTAGTGDYSAAPDPGYTNTRSLLWRDDFGQISNWTVTGGLLSANTTYVRNGQQSMRFVANTTTAQIDRALSTPLDVSHGSIRLYWYTPGAPDNPHLTGGASLYIRMYSGDGQGGAWRENAYYNAGFHTGWQTDEIPITTFTGTDGLPDASLWDPTNVTRITIGWRNVSPGSTVLLDELSVWNNQGPARFVWTFDDGEATGYNTIAPMLTAHGWRGVFAIIGSRIGQQGYLTLAQVKSLYNQGFLIVNHSWSHASDWTTWTTAQREADEAQNRQWLIDNGMPHGADIFVAPYGFCASQADMDAFFRHASVVMMTAPTDRYAYKGQGKGQYGWMASPPGDTYIFSRGPVDTSLTDTGVGSIEELANSPFLGLTDVHNVFASPPAGYLSISDFSDRLDFMASEEAQGKLHRRQQLPGSPSGWPCVRAGRYRRPPGRGAFDCQAPGRDDRYTDPDESFIPCQCAPVRGRRDPAGTRHGVGQRRGGRGHGQRGHAGPDNLHRRRRCRRKHGGLRRPRGVQLL